MSTSVDFYVLKDPKASAAAMLACRLTEKAYLNANSVYIYCDTPQNANAIDQLLWTFKDDSFIPHTLASAASPLQTPISVGCDLTTLRRDYDILINLHPDIATNNENFKRILDIVANEPHLKEQGRLRYKYYRNANYPLTLHEL